MEARRVQTRSPYKADTAEGNLLGFDISGKKYGSNSDLDSCQSSPSFPKRRRIMLDDMSVSSAFSSQVSSCMSSRSHSPSLSECTLDDSILGSPGNSPSATLKEHIKRRYSKYELLTSIESDYQYLMDKEIIEACKTEDGDEDGNKVSLAEFHKQYQELSEWLSQVQNVMQRTIPGTVALSEKYLNQSYHEELLKQSPRHKLFNDYAAQLEERYPRMKEEIKQRLYHLNSQWEAVEHAVAYKDIWENTEMMVKDLQTDLKCLHDWLGATEHSLQLMSLQPSFNDDLIQNSLLQHQSLQKDIEAHSRHVNAVLKLSERLQDELTGDYDQEYFHRSAQNIQQRWHGIWLQSLEEQCKLENALKKKPKCSPGSFLTGWIPSSFHGNHNRSGDSTNDDSFGLIPRQADIAESPQISDSSYSVSPKSGNNSGKDSAVVSEVELKMSSECSDSDLDMMRKNRLRVGSKDIGYSSGTSASPITTGHTSTESECDDIKKLIDQAEVLVSGKQSPGKKKKVYSSCDASSEESDGKGEFSTASDNDGEDLFDSVLGLDYTSDTTHHLNTLPRFCDTTKLRKYKQRKDRPWSVIQFTDQDKLDLTDLSKSETAIDRLNYGPDSPTRTLNNLPGTFPRIGAKRKLCIYESSFTEDVCAEQDSDTESSTSDDYHTANTEQSEAEEVVEEEDAGLVSTTSFSEPTWDNYHQLTVYTSLGEDQEEPLHWTPLDEDLEFDDVFPKVKSSSLIAGAIDSKKKKETKVKTKVSPSNRAGYDSDSDLEDLIYFIEDSASQLKFTEKYLKKKGKDPFGTGIDINTNKYAEIIATCETNIRCLQNVHMHLDTEATEEETERIREILYQWEKLHAFATERQLQSQQLSHMCKCLEEIQSDLQECDFHRPKSKFTSLEEVDNYLKNAQIHEKILLNLEKKVKELEEKTAAFIQEHPAINMEIFQKQQHQAEKELKEKLDRVSTDLPHLRHIHKLWNEYNVTRQELEQLLRVEKRNLENVAAKLETEGSGAVLTIDLQGHIDTLMKYEEKMGTLQSLRGQLVNVMDDQTRDELTMRLAEIHDELYAAQNRCRELLENADPENMEHVEQKIVAAESSSSSRSWLKSRYVHVAAVFMVLGLAYLVNPSAIGDLGVTITPELRYVNGPPPM